MLRFWVTLHVLFAVTMFGPTFAFPFIGMAAKKGGDVKTALGIINTIVHKLVLPADYLMPLTGTLIIVSSKGGYNPFEKSGRWLLSAIILYAVMFVVANFVQIPAMKKALKMIDSGNMGPEFGALMEKQGKVGALLGLLIIIIVILMVAKPGI